jgi:hypothetical protein
MDRHAGEVGEAGEKSADASDVETTHTGWGCTTDNEVLNPKRV